MGKPELPSVGGDKKESSSEADELSTLLSGCYLSGSLEEACNLLESRHRSGEPTHKSQAASSTHALELDMDESQLNRLIKSVRTELLPGLRIESVEPHDPVQVRQLPAPWQLVGTGNYATVVNHPDHPELVVKIYAPGRPGFEEEVEVYRRLGSHPAFSECLYAADGVLILKRLHGTTLYDCIHLGMPIPEQVIRDIDQALDYARSRGLHPHDVHGRNVMIKEGRGLVVDISDFLHEETCNKWNNLKQAYYLLYRPFLSPLRLRVPYFALDGVRKGYRLFSRQKRTVIVVGAGVLVVLITATVYAKWREQDDRCVRYLPDGSKKTLYGKDCNR